MPSEPDVPVVRAGSSKGLIAPLRGLLAANGGDGGKVVIFALAYAGSAAVQKGLGFLLFMWFAHSMSVDDYARFGLLYALQTGVAALALAGIIETVIGRLKTARTDAQQRELLQSANLIFMGTATVSIAVVCMAFAWSNAFGWMAMIAAAFGGAFTGFFTIQSQLSRIVERHLVALLLGFAPAVMALAAGLAGFLISHNALGFFAGSVVGFALALPLVRLTPVGLPRTVPDRGNLDYIARHMGPFVLVAMVDWFLGYGSSYLVKVFFPIEIVARFVFAYTLSSIMHLLATSLNQAWSPRVFKLLHSVSVEEVERQNQRFYLIQGVVLGLVGGTLLAVLPLILDLVGGNISHYRGMGIETLLLFASYAAVIPWYHAQNYYYAHAKGPTLMRISIASSIVGLALWIVSALILGPLGAYVGYMAMTAAKMVSGVWWARREWHIRILWHGPVVSLGLLIAGSLTAACYSGGL